MITALGKVRINDLKGNYYFFSALSSVVPCLFEIIFCLKIRVHCCVFVQVCTHMCLRAQACHGIQESMISSILSVFGINLMLSGSVAGSFTH